LGEAAFDPGGPKCFSNLGNIHSYDISVS
jgi:hypothetical protein